MVWAGLRWPGLGWVLQAEQGEPHKALPWRSQQSNGGENMTKKKGNRATVTKETVLTLDARDRHRGERPTQSCLMEKQCYFYSTM